MSKISIVISPSQQAWNKCVMADTEQNHTYIIGEKVFDLLKNYDCNSFLIPKITGTENETLSKIVAHSNSFVRSNPNATSFHLDIHTDAGYSATGASAFYISEGGKAFIQKIYSEVCKITPWADGGVSQRNLYVLRETLAVAGLVELSFHDRKNEAEWIHAYSDAIAEAIVRGLVLATGITKKVDTEFQQALVNLTQQGKISSPEYWLNTYNSANNFNKEYVRTLIINLSK